MQLHPSRAARRRIPALAAAAALVAASLVPSVQAPAGAISDCGLEGEGTPTEPYLVEDAADLAKVGVGDCGLDAHYLQTDDIVLVAPAEGESNHTPIGPDPANNGTLRFTGTYDGGDKVIAGMVVRRLSSPSLPFIGMFGATGTGAKLVGIRLVDVEIAVRSNSEVGALVGENTGEISRSSAAGNVTAERDARNLGGLVGSNRGGDIAESFAEVDVAAPATSDSLGGLVGVNDGGTIARSFATGDVTGGARVGGLVGYQFGGGSSLTDSYATGDVDGPSAVGGLVGDLDSGAVVRSYSIGEVPTSGAGGLIGDNDKGTITASFWDTETSKKSASAGSGAIGKLTADMKEIATFTTGIATAADRWSIEATCERVREASGSGDTVWGLCGDINDGYPFLRIGAVVFPEPPVEDEDGDNGNGDNGNGDNGENGDTENTDNGANGNTENPENGQESTTPGTTPGTTSPVTDSAPVTPVRADRVLVGGVVPSVPAGAGVWVRADGSEVALTVSTPEAGQVRFEADGVRVTFTGAEGTSASAGAHTLQLAFPVDGGTEAVNVGLTVGGPVPTEVPSGEGGPGVPAPLGLLLVALVSVAGAVLVGRRALADG